MCLQTGPRNRQVQTQKLGGGGETTKTYRHFVVDTQNNSLCVSAPNKTALERYNWGRTVSPRSYVESRPFIGDLKNEIDPFVSVDQSQRADRFFCSGSEQS